MTLNNSVQEGRKVIKEYTKVMLRAFNGECEAAAAKVSYSNVNTMVERIGVAFENINRLGQTTHLSISRE